MKNSFVSAVTFVLIFIVSGCGIGGMWMNGNPFPAPVKPYLEYWEKPGWTAETRMQSSADCGGGFSNRPAPSQKMIRETQQTGESEYNATVRLRYDWQRCMVKKGYRYTGECYDNEISRASPACGAP